MVLTYGQQLMRNWEVRSAHKRDILLAMALAHCGLATTDLAAAPPVRTGPAPHPDNYRGMGQRWGRVHTCSHSRAHEALIIWPARTFSQTCTKQIPTDLAALWRRI
jgi:hypothetical protein